MPEQYVTVNVSEIVVGEELPTTVYIYIDFRFITFRAEGDIIDRTTYDRLVFKKVKNLFVVDTAQKKYEDWLKAHSDPVAPEAQLTPEQKELKETREDVKRKMLDIFQSTHPDKIVVQAMSSSKKLVSEVMKIPYAVRSLAELQERSKGTVDHSVNVSILSVYLAMQMGYTHNVILQHVGMGALLHDVGKSKVPIADGDSKEVIEQKMMVHPEIGLQILDSQDKVPNEVKMIVAQHHENYDGTGFPKKLRGNAIYDLARIVSIANKFDGLVADGKGSLVERQRNAIRELHEVHYKKFDPVKLEKVVKILKLGV